MHDGPTARPDGSREFGTMFLDVAGRAAPSADNAHAAFFFMVNDEGVWLIERPRGRAAVELFQSIPPRWEDRTEADWLAFAAAVKRKVHDGRLAFPSSDAGRTTWPGTASSPTCPARPASCRWSTSRASTSTGC